MTLSGADTYAGSSCTLLIGLPARYPLRLYGNAFSYLELRFGGFDVTNGVILTIGN